MAASGRTTRNRLPYPTGTADAFSPRADMQALADLLDVVLPPIGACIPYCGLALPAGTYWDLADGHLIDRGAGLIGEYFYAAVGHAYNGGVDPGSGKVRLPDKRGRVSVGADNMGTVLYGTSAGAGGRTPNSNRARGQNGGEERHVLVKAEMAAHRHGLDWTTGGGRKGVLFGPTNGEAGIVNGSATFGGGVIGYAADIDGNDQAHNNLAPYEVDLMIVRLK
jgi:microcystin-dependent protein